MWVVLEMSALSHIPGDQVRLVAELDSGSQDPSLRSRSDPVAAPMGIPLPPEASLESALSEEPEIRPPEVILNEVK